ncbi:hypothetical protein IWX75_000678 [Arthrobacter sp. CAN_A6]|uniref:hypothetical protein n=1 Tax=Arthrobacter sp. CAN_A6 TaxID=2787721 RepID=UPI0018CBBAFB
MNAAGDPLEPGESLLPVSPPARATNTWLTSSRVIAFVVLLAVVTVGGMLLLGGKEKSSTPLGAAAVIDGGLARINGIVPLEQDGWTPPDAGATDVFDSAAVAGAHRVRVVLELTAVEPGGILFDPTNYSISGLAAGTSELLLAVPGSRSIQQGSTVNTELVFEIPDRAVELALEGPDDMRLSLGVSHHTGG